MVATMGTQPQLVVLLLLRMRFFWPSPSPGLPADRSPFMIYNPLYRSLPQWHAGVLIFSARDDGMRVSWAGTRGFVRVLASRKPGRFSFGLLCCVCGQEIRDGVLAGEGHVGCPEERRGVARRNAAHGRHAG